MSRRKTPENIENGPLQEFYIGRSMAQEKRNAAARAARQKIIDGLAGQNDEWARRAKPGWLQIIREDVQEERALGHTSTEIGGSRPYLSPARAAMVDAILREQAKESDALRGVGYLSVKSATLDVPPEASIPQPSTMDDDLNSQSIQALLAAA